MRTTTGTKLALLPLWVVMIGALALLVGDPSPSSADASLCDPATTTCRTIEVVNNCIQDVWVAAQGNAAYCDSNGECESSTTCNVPNHTCNCTSDMDCAPDTQVCDTSTNPAQCEWARPMNGGWKLASNRKRRIHVPNKPGKSQSISWAGRFWGRTGCPDFATCGQPGTVCAQDSDCCTNAGCAGLFECQNDTQCNTWACTSDADCGIGTCNLTNNLCENCVSGQCACRTSTDCQGGGQCENGGCVGQCEANGVACDTGDCLGILHCELGIGGKAPYTLAEVALVWGRRSDLTKYDTYDVSQVDGFNLPVEVAPTKNALRTPKSISSLPWCGKPGCALGSDCPVQNDACAFDPTDYPSCLCGWGTDDSSCPAPMQAVSPLACSSDGDCAPGTCDSSTTPPTCTCTSNADCPSSAPTCGLNANVTGKQVCGTYVGCMSPNNACSTDSTLSGANFSCADDASLYGCTGTNGQSCYTVGAGADCCGCPSWSPGGNTNLPIVNGCQSTNGDWTSGVQPLVATFKDACPTAYSFGYDDPTSTFNCASKGPRKPLKYTITFCPCGSPGALGQGSNFCSTGS